MAAITYEERRGELKTYFDRTAVEAWARLTSEAPVGRIRATVRVGRERMRQTLLDWLPADLTGTRLLDAGCGTGALAVAAARRGAEVVAVDLSPTLIALAEERRPDDLHRLRFSVGDMLDPGLGRFDFVVIMDSLIHYSADDVVEALARIASRTEHSISLTFAPRTLALSALHALGQVLPKADRAPAIAPLREVAFRRRLRCEPRLGAWRLARSVRISNGFYISQALELRMP
jgi:magnesium-protoporphyrin O-methyltransferase